MTDIIEGLPALIPDQLGRMKAAIAEPRCHYCDRLAGEDYDARSQAREDGVTPADIAREDGTYNPATNRYACTRCYISIGMPSSPRGWRVPS